MTNQRGIDALGAQDFIDQEGVRNDAIEIINAYIAQNRHGRGPFMLHEDGSNQVLPGITVPSWLAMLLNWLCSSDLTPYNNDRPAMLRDLLLLGAAGVYSALQRVREQEEGVARGVHIIRHEETLRADLYIEELMLNYTEDLAVAAQGLQLKLEAGDSEEVFNSLKKLFDHATTAPSNFWRITILGLVFGCPEVNAAIQHLRDQWRYASDHEFNGWAQLYEEVRGSNE